MTITDVTLLMLGHPLPPIHLQQLAIALAVTLGVGGLVGLHTREMLRLARRLEEVRHSTKDGTGSVVRLPSQPDRRSRVGDTPTAWRGPHRTRH